MSASEEGMNGLSHCRYEDKELAVLNNNFARLIEASEKREQWFNEYVDRSIPLKSHFKILAWSLAMGMGAAIGFSAAVQILERLLKF